MEWSDLIDQLKADFASKKERESAIKERDQLMSDMEFQGRAQHQMQKEFPEYSKSYGNRAIYNPKQDLSGFANNPDVQAVLESLKEDPSLANLHTRSFQLRDLGQNMAAKALSQDKYNTKDPIDFINQLRLKDNLDYNIALDPDLRKKHDLLGLYTTDDQDPTKKLIINSDKDDISTWLHEHLHAKNKDATPASRTEQLSFPVHNQQIREQEINTALETKDINKLRQMLSGGHFDNRTDEIPELYVQNEFEDIMKNRGFETRKDPIKSRFQRLKQLMRY